MAERRSVGRLLVQEFADHPGLGDDLADVVYTAPASLVYGTRLEGKLPVDVVLASPSLEVGVDLEMLTESVMTKAMRNIASYRQKAGRVGREEGLDVINVTLVHDAPVDLHYYRQPRKLVSRGRLDPIPLKDRNDAILFSGLYNAIWDWLALRQLLPEPVPTQLKPDGLSEFADRLRQCLNALTTPGPRTELAEHLRAVARGMREVTNAELDAAVGQTIDEIGILLRDATGTLSIQPPLTKATLADVLILMDLAKTRMVRDVRPKLGSDLEPFYEHALKDLERLLPRLPVGLESDLARFHDLLEMHHTGDWDADKIHVLIEELRTHYSGGVGSPVAPTVLNLQNVVLPSLEGALRAIVPGHDPLVYSIWESYRNLLNGRDAWHRRYLFDLMRDLTGLEAVRKERWFMRPDNLFTNPFEPQVSILTAPGRERDSISVGEAVASYLPGVWTFRFPEGCYKVKSGVLNQGLGGRLVARLPDIVAEGTAVERAQTKLPPPPGLLSPIDVYRPLRLSLREERRKYVELDRLRGLVLDGDEVRSGSGPVAERSHIKIPKSYLNRWIHVRPEETRPILTLAPDEGRFFVGTPPDTVEGEDARKKSGILFSKPISRKPRGTLP